VVNARDTPKSGVPIHVTAAPERTHSPHRSDSADAAWSPDGEQFRGCRWFAAARCEYRCDARRVEWAAEEKSLRLRAAVFAEELELRQGLHALGDRLHTEAVSESERSGRKNCILARVADLLDE
jgi:hypothetical protein